MASHKSNDTLVERLERQGDLKGIESNANGLFYFYSSNDDRIGIINCKSGQKEGAIVLTKTQAKALVEEFPDICEMVFGRKKW